MEIHDRLTFIAWVMENPDGYVETVQKFNGGVGLHHAVCARDYKHWNWEVNFRYWYWRGVTSVPHGFNCDICGYDLHADP